MSVLRSGTFGGGGKISSDKVRGKADEGQESSLVTKQCFQVKRWRMIGKLTVQ